MGVYKYTIGGMTPTKHPETEHAKELGQAIVDLTEARKKDNLLEQFKAYKKIMYLRRYFTIRQWDDFLKDIDSFRHGKKMNSLSAMLTYTSVKVTMGNETRKILQREIEAKLGKSTNTNIIKEKGGKDMNPSKIDLVVHAFGECLVSFGERLVSIAELEGPDSTEDKPKTVKKTQVKGKTAGTKRSPLAEPEDVPVSVNKVSEVENVTEEIEVPVDEKRDYRRECQLAIAGICKVAGSLESVTSLFTELGYKGLGSCPKEDLPALLTKLNTLLEESKVING